MKSQWIPLGLIIYAPVICCKPSPNGAIDRRDTANGSVLEFYLTTVAIVSFDIKPDQKIWPNFLFSAMLWLVWLVLKHILFSVTNYNV